MANSYVRRFTIPTLEKCCCLQLKTGGILITSLWMIPITLGVGFSAWELIVTAISRGRVRQDDALANLTEEIEVLENWHDSIIQQFLMVHCAILVLFLACLLNIYGSIKERRIFMIPFMTVTGTFINVVICSEIMRILFWTITVVDFFISLFLGGFGIYSMLILVSFYRQLEQKPSTAKEDDVIEAIEGVL